VAKVKDTIILTSVSLNLTPTRAMLVVLVLGIGSDFPVFAEYACPCASTVSGDIEIVPFKSTVWQ
jgi:hypothetical protein